MEVVLDKIVINDNYDGVLILDSELNIIKSIKVSDDFVIETSFIHNNEIVLYCYENKCFIYINIASYAYKIIPLNNDFEDINFLPLYEWADHDLILLADNGIVFTHVNLFENTVKLRKKDEIDRLQFSIYDYWDKINKFLIHKIYSDNYIAIVESDKKIMIVDYKNNTEYALNIEPDGFHDFETTINCTVSISEEKIQMLYDGKKMMFYPDFEDYRFLRGKFITIDKVEYLLLLMCSNSDSSEIVIQRNAYNN